MSLSEQESQFTNGNIDIRQIGIISFNLGRTSECCGVVYCQIVVHADCLDKEKVKSEKKIIQQYSQLGILSSSLFQGGLLSQSSLSN